MDGRHTDGRTRRMICRCCGPIRFDSVVVLAMRTSRGSKPRLSEDCFEKHGFDTYRRFDQKSCQFAA